jgi:di/tricarboxylate transporter
MGQMETWEMILLGVLVALILVWLGPGVKRSMENSRKGTSKEWMGVVAILGAVVLFVLLLIAMV